MASQMRQVEFLHYEKIQVSFFPNPQSLMTGYMERWHYYHQLRNLLPLLYHLSFSLPPENIRNSWLSDVFSGCKQKPMAGRS